MARYQRVNANMPNTQLRSDIISDLNALTSGDLAAGATKLFQTIGYQSTRFVPDTDDDSPDAFLKRVSNVTDTQSEQEFRNQVSAVKLLFQVTDSEIQAASSAQGGMFENVAGEADANVTQSFFFAVAELKGNSYPRGVYARVAREINKRLPIATVVLMRNANKDVSLAFVDRRPHKRDANRAVLGNVALLREIETRDPHRAHLDILSGLELNARLEWMANNGKSNDFAGLLAAWLDVLNTEELNKRFYRGLFKWYQRATEVARFPKTDEPVEEQVIRLITRLMFVWFIKEKRFVANELFNEHQVSQMLKDYDAQGGDSYYRCILQNLFFGTLNTPVVDRKFAIDAGDKADDTNASGFSYKFVNEIEQVEDLRESFHNSPFVNGGLFDCLDEYGDNGEAVKVIDCFSDNPEHSGQMSIPNRLFFDDDGIVTHFKEFKFTVEESTPLEQEVALDPELLGNVFESLLAAYVPETSKSKEASKQAKTGSYYTPRKVVDYMVDEALKESLLARISDDLAARDNLEDTILDLFDYGNTEQPFGHADVETLVRAIAETKILDPAVGSGAFPMAALHKLTLALRKLDPTNELWQSHQRNLALERTQEAFDEESQADRDEMLDEISQIFETYRDSDYGRKLFLIQNCIFGVDIQPIAVQISKLRFFISLAIEQRVDSNEENHGIRALPNLETRFVIADTLLPLHEPEQMTLGDSETISDKLQTLMANRERHFREYMPAEKDALRRTDDSLRRDLAAHLRQRGMPATDADQLAAWDPFNHSSVAQWFNAKYMFNVQDGFDVVIGNPPYARLQSAGGLLANRYEPVGYKTFSREGDIYQLFQELSLDLASSATGVAALITSNSWMRSRYGDGTRKVLGAKERGLSLIELGRGVFPNVIVDTNILFVTNSHEARDRNRAVDVERSNTNSFPPTDQDWGLLGRTDGQSWSPMSSQDTKILRSMLESGKQLKDWEVGIFRGFTTGLNAAFVIPDDIRRELIDNDNRASEIIKPVLRGRDIHRFQANQTQWLIASHNGYDQRERISIDDFPSVKSFLDEFGGKLIRRLDQGSTAYNMRDCTYYGQFSKERLFWKELSDSGSFTFESREMYCVNSAFIMTGESLKYHCGVLNSSIVAWYKRHISLNTGMGLSRWVKFVMDRIPVPEASEGDRQAIAGIVDEILTTKAKRADADTSELEAQIDGIVYDLYGLTASQVEVVEDAMRR